MVKHSGSRCTAVVMDLKNVIVSISGQNESISNWRETKSVLAPVEQPQSGDLNQPLSNPFEC